MGNFVLVFTCSNKKRIISVSGDFTEAVHRNIAKAMHLHTKEMNHKDMWKTPLLGHSSHCQVPAPHMMMRVGSFRMHVFSGATVWYGSNTLAKSIIPYIGPQKGGAVKFLIVAPDFDLN